MSVKGPTGRFHGWILSLVLLGSTPVSLHAGTELIFKHSFETCGDLEIPEGAREWDGGGDDESWSDPLNWDGDVLPANDEMVVIGDFPGLTVTYSSLPDPLRLSYFESCVPLNLVTGMIELDGPATMRARVDLSGNIKLQVNDTLEVRAAFVHSGNGSLDGTGTVTVAGLYTWERGTQEGAGVTIANGGISIENTTHTLRERTLTLNAASSWTGGNVNLWNAAVLNNNTTLDIQTDADMPHASGAAATLNNAGTLTKTVGADLTSMAFNFSNAGTVSVTSGELNLGRNNEVNSSTGAFVSGSGSILGVSGSHNMTGASSFTGQGGFRMFGGGTTTINGTFTMAGPIAAEGGTVIFNIPVTFSGTVSIGNNTTLELTQASTIDAAVELSGNGTLLANADVPVSGAFSHSGNGSLDGTGTVTVAGLYTWERGTQEGAGVTIANGGISIENTTHTLRERTLTLNAASSWTGGNVNLWNAAVLNNNTTLDIQTDADMPHASGAAATLNNAGTLTKTVGADLTSMAFNFSNAGTVSVTSGELNLGRNNEVNSSTGAFVSGSGSILGVSGSHNMTGASSFTGQGGFRMFGGGTTTINGTFTMAGPIAAEGGTVIFNIPVTFSGTVSIGNNTTLELTQASTIDAAVELSGNGTLLANADVPVSGAFSHSGNGSLDGTGTVTVAGLYTWERGTQEGAGVTIANGGISIENTTHTLRERTLTLNAASSWTGGNVNLWNAAVLNNNTTLDIQTDADMPHASGAAATLNNAGTLTKTVGADLTSMAFNFSNAGTVSVTSGELNLGRNNEVNSSTGAFVSGSGSILGVSGSHNMTGASSFTGQGGFRMFGGGTTTINGTFTMAGPIAAEGGTVIFNIPVTFSGTVSIGNNTTLELTQASTIDAAVELSGNGTLLANADVPVSGAFSHSGNGSLDGTGTVTVAGLYTWERGTQEGAGVTIANGGISIENTTHTLRERTLTLNAASSWTGGNVNLWNAAVLNNNTTLDIQTDADMPHASGAAATLNNAGTLTKSLGNDLTNLNADFTNSGAVSADSGSLGFQRTYTQDASGSLTVRIASGAYDTFAVSLAATLDGTLDIQRAGGYEPGLGTMFDVLTAQSVSGQFSTIENASIGNGTEFSDSYGATDVTLTVVSE